MKAKRSITTKLWWCSLRQAYIAKPCICNDYDIMQPCGWTEHTYAPHLFKGKPRRKRP